MKQKYRAAIVGAGSIGNAHMEGYRLIEGIDVVAVVDPYEPARKTYIDQYEIPNGYSNVLEMLEQEKPDIVSVCTWHLLHSKQTIEIANSPGIKGIICEKPMAISMGEAKQMMERSDSNGVKLVIAHQRRFTPGWEKAREMVNEGLIGNPIRAELRVKDGLLNWGTHSIDGARFILNDPQAQWVIGSIDRHTNRYERDVPIEDASIGLIHLESNTQIFIQSDLWDINSDAGKFFIYGTDGMINITETKIQLFNSTTNGWKNIRLKISKNDIPIGGNTNASQVRELIHWIEGGAEHRGSAKRALDTLEIIMAIYESARRNQVITLPFEANKYPLEQMIEEKLVHLKETKRYDIRSFLKRDGIDEQKYTILRKKGMGHEDVMRKLNS